jgi:hypothetical protein
VPSLAVETVPVFILEPLAAKIVALVYAVEALPVIQLATLPIVPELLPRYVVALDVSTNTLADKPAVV